MPKHRVDLTDEERLLVLLYRSVAEATRTSTRHLLFEAWTHPLPRDREEYAVRFREASEAMGQWLTVQAFESFVSEPGRRQL